MKQAQKYLKFIANFSLTSADIDASNKLAVVRYCVSKEKCIIIQKLKWKNYVRISFIEYWNGKTISTLYAT
jgi:hypothetical protein